MTSLEFERMVNAGGPTKGAFISPKGRKTSVSVGFIQCVGSRSQQKGGIYCSNICCMISSEPITSEIITEYCKACGKCAQVCPYNAITVDTKKKTPAVVNTAACSGCGTCATECAFGAIVMNQFYIDANHWTEKRIKKIHKKMEKMGIRRERLQMEWISAAEGIRFAQVMKDMEKLRLSVSSGEIEETVRILKERVPS